MNRQLLGDAGLSLSDDDYACAIAGIGFVETILEPEPVVRWSLTRLDQLTAQKDIARSVLIEASRRWNGVLAEVSEPRVVIEVDSAAPDAPDPCEILAILTHPAAKISAAWIHWYSPEVDIRWQWPLRLAALKQDYEALELDGLKGPWPSNTLFAPVHLGREPARAEVLVIHAGPRAALARVLALPYRVRAGLIMLIAPLDVTWRTLRPRLDALMAETQAGGVIILPASTAGPETGGGLVNTLNHWVTELSHNTPMDLAMGRVRRDALMCLDQRLIAAARIPVAAMAVSQRLRRLTRRASFHLPEHTPGRIGLGWTHAKPPAELGLELESVTGMGRLPMDAESSAASAMSELEVATRAAERATAADDARRFLQGDVTWFVNGESRAENRALVVGQRYALDVFIAPDQAGEIVANEAFPDDSIDWPAAEKVTLQVLFAEPTQWDEPMWGTVEMGRTGRSTTCRFVLTPTRPGAFAGRVTLHHRGRALQTALLKTQVVRTVQQLDSFKDTMQLQVESTIRLSMRNLDDRRRFDAMLLCNHTTNRKAAVTAAGKNGAYIASLGNTTAAVANINQLLSQVALDNKYNRGLTTRLNADLLFNLALEGNALYRALVLDNIDKSTAAAQVRDSEYLQVVTVAPDAMVPLEFVYEYAVPKKGAPVCPNAKQALRDGKCPVTCQPQPNSGAAAHVCPMGFWGLSKVIERHMNVLTLRKDAKVLAQKRSEPESGRDQLSLAGGTLVATSKQIPKKNSTAFDRALRVLRKKAGTCVTAGNWEAWVAGVKECKPTLLVALPHASGNGAHIELEIGGDSQLTAAIDRSYVHGDSSPPPIAILLGCDTQQTVTTDAYLTHVGVFRQADAALVLGTVATVLGVDAADVAQRLLKQLVTTVKKEPGRFGEVLRATKRAAVADSRMIALCLVAFGDADWSITV